MNGDEIKARRQAAGLSQSDLAAAIDKTASYISRLEAGDRTPSAEVRGRLLGVLGKVDPVLEAMLVGVLRDGEVRFNEGVSSLPPVMRLLVESGRVFPSGSEVIAARASVASEGQWVLAGAPDRDRAWFGRLRSLGDTKVIALDGNEDDLVVVTKSIMILARGVSLSQPLEFLG